MTRSTASYLPRLAPLLRPLPLSPLKLPRLEGLNPPDPLGPPKCVGDPPGGTMPKGWCPVCSASGRAGMKP